MKRRIEFRLTVVLVGLFVASCNHVREEPAFSDISGAAKKPPQGVVLSAADVDHATLSNWSGHAVAIWLNGGAAKETEIAAARMVLNAGSTLDYFIEIGRCPELADEHPAWMASLQGHDEWRRLFPDFQSLAGRQVVKNYPWVPILYEESFEAHLKRVEALLRGLPVPRRVWLNDLQGAPSACGCGHPLCRWTADYGPVKTATPRGDDAAARFVEAVAKLVPASEVIPILVGECEEADRETVCHGVECFEGICWKAFSRQLDALSGVAPRIGVGCFYREFSRDFDRYGGEAGWVRWTLESFSKMPRLRNGVGVMPDRLIAVVQGWDVSSEQLQAQLDQAGVAGAAEQLIVVPRLDQSWQPQVFDLPDSFVMPGTSTSDHDH